jgi:hypothetical protein
MNSASFVRWTAAAVIGAYSWAATAPAAARPGMEKRQLLSGPEQAGFRREDAKPSAVAGKPSEIRPTRKKFPWLIVIGAAAAVAGVVAVLLLTKKKDANKDATDCKADSGAGIADSDKALVARAENMLATRGVTIADGRDDWIWTGFPDDNPNPYPVPFADLAGITFAVDADYLYVRIQANGTYPASEADRPWYGQDQITKLNINIALDTDNNEMTGSPGDKGAEVLLGAGMMMTPACGWMDVYEFWFGPTGIEQPEDKRWLHANNRSLIAAAWGGRGTDHRVIVFPAGILGVYPGQTIGVSAWDECASLRYPNTHATLDPLGPVGIGSRVVIRLPT